MPGIPPYEFRVFSRLRRRRSWTEGLQRFASPRPTDGFSTCTRCSGLRSSSYGHGSSCKGAASSFRPRTVSHHAMRFDMVNDRCRDETAFCFATNAPGMTFQEKLPGLLPLPSVATCFCISPFPLALPFMFLTIFSSIRHQPGAARIFAGRLRSSRHLHHLRHQKRTDGVQARPFILFLLIIVYLTEASDIKCCFSDIQ